MTTTSTTETPAATPTTVDTAALERAARRAAAKRAKLEQADREITALDAARYWVAVHRDAEAAATPEVVALDATADQATDALYAVLCGKSEPPSDSRRESLRIAIRLGADRDALRALAGAVRLSRSAEITLPPGKYAGLSRGRDWRRRSDGHFEDGPVGPGKWTVGSTDGFSRQSRVEWVVEHVRVGDQTWTVAS